MLKKAIFSLFFATLSTAALAQTFTPIQANAEHSAYLQDSHGTIVRSGSGLCWRTGQWTPADAVSGCDGELVPPVATPIAPPIVPPVAMPPQPAAPASPPVAVKRCDFSIGIGSDQGFGFDQGRLNHATQNAIDTDVLSKLGVCSMIESIVITGHTDRLGSSSYNRKLSQKRAESVAAYLKGKGVAAPIQTLGLGEAQPVTSCEGRLRRAKLIECLAPNRRVVIQVRGIAKE